MNIALGIHIGHDRGACLIKDGEVIAAISQERIDRRKHSQSLNIPFDSIDAILGYCNLTIRDVSCIALSAVAIEGENIYNMYVDNFFKHYNCDYIPFYLVHHHDAHAYSSYFSSGFNDSLVFVFDGGGDFIGSMQESESVYIAKNGKLTRIDRRLQNMAVRHMKDAINHIYPFMPENVQNLQMSIARKYSQITHLLGFGFGQEGKTMGLASYGTSLLDYSYIDYKSLNFSLTYKDLIYELYILQQKSGRTFEDFICRERANIAATVQSFTEKAVITLIKSYTQKYSIKKICLAGGLFLNCLTNHKLIEQCELDDVFIIPSAGDDGQALGCAYYAYIKQFGAADTKFEINLPYLGLSYGDDEIERSIQNKNLKYTKLNDEQLTEFIAKNIGYNKIIALHRGRTEIGPRALCHRSIIANPTCEKMKDILNKRVKHREPFRPFAPTVVKEKEYKYFDLKHTSKYMLLAATVKEKYRKPLAAITHIDNTARIQSISEKDDPFLYRLLLKVENITGFPVLLNTSFNDAGKPIVETPQDALNTFLTTQIDILVIGNFVIDKETM